MSSATNFATASFQEIIDLHTEADTVSVLGLHTPTGTLCQNMLRGFYTQFQKVKYNGLSVSLVPAARLPADPLQVSYEAGETTIDPRDMLNPILFHGCHGNDMGAILNGFYGQGLGVTPSNSFTPVKHNSESSEMSVISSDFPAPFPNLTFMESLYYRALTDRTWQKAHPQAGFRKCGLHPMVYRVASNAQFANTFGDDLAIAPTVTANNDSGVNNLDPSAGSIGIAQSNSFTRDGDPVFVGKMPSVPFVDSSTFPLKVKREYQSNGMQFMSTGLRPLGWIDTRQPIGLHNESVSVADAAKLNEAVGDLYMDKSGCAGDGISGSSTGMMSVSRFPKVYMGMIMLPPAYKTEQYFRLVLTHSVSFKGFRGVSMMQDSAADVNMCRGINDWN